MSIVAFSIPVAAMLLVPAGVVLLLCAGATPPAFSEQTDSGGGPKFAVASIKRDPSGRAAFIVPWTDDSPRRRGNRYHRPLAALSDVIKEAYAVQDSQIVGLPEWALSPNGEHYIIDARADGVPSVDELRHMIQNLLAERFQLRTHWEKKTLQAYVLLVSRNGLKLRKISEEEATQPEKEPGKNMRTSMALLAQLLSIMFQCPVVDRTGLAGLFEYPSPNFGRLGQEARMGPSGEGPSAFSEFQAQLGLQLNPSKESIDVIIIDHVEKPSAN